ncbi:LAGLIDADG family homing endonuclease [Streptomyces prunicolor]
MSRIDLGWSAETPIWLPGGQSLPVCRIVDEQLPVLTYDKAWDLREPTVGRAYPPRDHSVGTLHGAVPMRWMEYRADLRPGWSVPVPLTADRFGTVGDEWDGWFIGLMLGDGSMTGRTPVWAGHDDGTLAQMREYVERNGCRLSVDDNGTWLRVRLTDPRWHQNRLRDLLVEHQVWGLKGEEKRVAGLPYSREFVCGLVAGLMDSDGSVGRTEAEFANISELLARQLSDVLLRLGVQNTVTDKVNSPSEKPLWRVRVTDARSVDRLAGAIRLRTAYKAEALAALASRRRDSRRTATGPRGYDRSIMWDRVVAVVPVGVKKTYGVQCAPSGLCIVDGVVGGGVAGFPLATSRERPARGHSRSTAIDI